MNKKRYQYIVPLIAALAFIGWGITSCDNGCEQTRENFMHVSFSSSTGRVLRGMEVIVSTGERGYMLTGINQFDDVEFDLCPDDSICYMLIDGQYTDFGDSFQLTDTVEICYTTQPYYLDMACGCTMNYEIQSVRSTHHLFHTVNVVDPVVLTESGINLAFEY